MRKAREGADLKKSKTVQIAVGFASAGEDGHSLPESRQSFLCLVVGMGVVRLGTKVLLLRLPRSRTRALLFCPDHCPSPLPRLAAAPYAVLMRSNGDLPR